MCNIQRVSQTSRKLNLSCNCILCLTGMEDEICPYATFHLLGFREEMDPSKALNFQTFPHQNGMGGPAHVGTLGPNGPMPHHMHSRSGSQSMVSVLFLVAFRFLCTKYVQPPLFVFHKTTLMISSSPETNTTNPKTN